MMTQHEAQDILTRWSLPWFSINGPGDIAAALFDQMRSRDPLQAFRLHCLYSLVDAAVDAGATRAGYVPLRLPLEIKELFEEWLRQHRPDRADRVLSLVRQTRGGALYNSEFHKRQTGEGAIAQLLSSRFVAAVKRLGLNRVRYRLDTQSFRVPEEARTALVDAKRDARQMRLL